jgi:hypothetical protein
MMQVWPDKYLFSGTMFLFFISIQPMMVPAIAEIQANTSGGSDYEYASYCLAWLVIALCLIAVVNSLILVLRHYSISDHPVVQLRFNALFTAFKQGSLASALCLPLGMLTKLASVYALLWAPSYNLPICLALSSGVLFTN